MTPARQHILKLYCIALNVRHRKQIIQAFIEYLVNLRLEFTQENFEAIFGSILVQLYLSSSLFLHFKQQDFG